MGHRYQDLIVWQRAMDLATEVYCLSARLPADEKYGLVSQLRRAAVSVASNIAEGQGRLTKGEFRQFLGTARGSLFELETQIQIALTLGLLTAGSAEAAQQHAAEVGRMLNGLIASVLETGNSKLETA